MAELKKVWFILLLVLFISSTACRRKDYPCPGLGNAKEADLSLFDEDGKLKDTKATKPRIDKGNGLVNKKNPKRIKAPRKNRI
ncbi:MAG TPA: hypothetical protein VF691_07760 [Cytophagaceae bacterium]|jgi:hypothetical protein